MNIRNIFKGIRGRGFLIIFLLNILLFLGDIVTTYLNKDLVQYLELNPIYDLFGLGLAPILVANITFFLLVYRLYYSKSISVFGRFALINMFVVLSYIRFIAINNALKYIKNPITIETAAAFATDAVKQAALIQLTFTIYSSLFLGLLAFWVWSWDHKVERID